jgi:hypothetical protein
VNPALIVIRRAKTPEQHFVKYLIPNLETFNREIAL